MKKGGKKGEYASRRNGHADLADLEDEHILEQSSKLCK